MSCVIGLKVSFSGITITALGTSLPDTFTSRSMTLHDEYADATIGNVTGQSAVLWPVEYSSSFSDQSHYFCHNLVFPIYRPLSFLWYLKSYSVGKQKCHCISLGYSLLHIWSYSQSHAGTYTCLHARMHACTHARTHAHVDICKQTHTKTYLNFLYIYAYKIICLYCFFLEEFDCGDVLIQLNFSLIATTTALE